ncbi:hypothetical protein ACJMK2_030604 [Sinanodonta woodiana]|uniref:Fucolectin tachylectin-4 pentraxin-1 domain-containing protein n=1 Tax=Sinanodonta woodiana TaxID=1069815 RepID=A0ABD3WW84_SINWO
MYRCHCVEDVQCDYITGNCPKGCAAGWIGPGCQYGDIAYNKQVQQFLYSINLLMDGNNATDGLPTTCVGPATWVEIDLSATYIISGLVMNSSDPMNLTGFEVRVGNYSSDQSSYIFDTCFTQPIAHRMDTSTDVVCTTEIVGRYILIKTPDNATTMTLCDVRVYGGRSLAYGHDGSQSSTISHRNFGIPVATRALDGNSDTRIQSYSCTHTENEMSPWWRVDLEVVYNIERIVLYGRSDCCTERLSGFSVSFATNSSFNLVFSHPMTTPPLITEVITLSDNHAQHVEISLKGISNYLTLCEVFVFGDCQDNMCGWTCDIYCYCEGPITKQNIIDARCTSGCKTGWWGYSCNNTCNVNCKDNKCSQTDGYCLECSQTKWGHFCDNNCTNCLHATGCGASDGICSVGCVTGYFGVSCGDHCGHCAADGSCDRYTGACIHGCQSGWQEEHCIIGRAGTSTESTPTLPIGIPVGGALGAVGLIVLIIVFAVMYRKRRKRVPKTSGIEHTYDQLDTTRNLHEQLSEYSNIEELGLSPVIPKGNTYGNTLTKRNLIPKSEFRDYYQHYVSLDDKTGELILLSVFNSTPSPATTKAQVTSTGRGDDCIETLNKSYLFEAKEKKELTILSDLPTTSEAIWRLTLEHRIHLIIIIGKNRIPFKPTLQVDIGLIQIECTDITVERDLMLCNINVSECEKDTKLRNVQVILRAEGCSFCIPPNINEALAVLKKRLELRQGIEVFNTLIICTPHAAEGEGFVASLLMTDVMERSGYIDIDGVIEAMRKEKHDVINSFVSISVLNFLFRNVT